MPRGEERRKSERLVAHLEVEVPIGTWEQLRRLYTRDINKGGLSFSLAPPASLPGDPTLVLTLPDKRKVALRSEVRHVTRAKGSEFDVGVQFQLDEESRRVLEEALAHLARSAGRGSSSGGRFLRSIPTSAFRLAQWTRCSARGSYSSEFLERPERSTKQNPKGVVEKNRQGSII